MNYEAHPIANEFPLLDAETHQDLVESMRKRGFDPLHPIVLFEGKILDGRNRYRAAEYARVEPVFRDFEGDWDAAVEFSLRENLWRRHLTAGQRALIAEGIADLTRGRPRTVPPPPPPPPGKGANLHNKPVSIEAAATKVHVSTRTVKYARELRELSPDHAERVKAGKESLNGALRKAKAAAAKKAGPPPPPPPPTDAAGRKIHPKAAYALGDGRGKFTAIIAALRKLKAEMLALQETELGRELHRQTIELESENLIRQFTSAIPFTSCPLNATCDEKCQLCRGTQWIGKLQWGGVPKEARGV